MHVYSFGIVTQPQLTCQYGIMCCDVTVRDDEFGNGDKLGTRSILRLSYAYER